MKNIRLTVIFIFAMLAFCLPGLAQEYKFTGGTGWQNGTLSVEKRQKNYQVTGALYANRLAACYITGIYYPTTGRLMGLCKNDSGQEWNVTGFKISNKDAFQFTIGKSIFVAHRSDAGVSGTWHIEQNGNGRTYRGTLILKQEGIKITGTIQWENHQSGRISGQLYENNAVTFTIYYSDGLAGYYKADLGSSSEDLVGGTAQSNKGGATVSWTAKRVSR